jgi:hypothetical protein
MKAIQTFRHRYVSILFLRLIVRVIYHDRQYRLFFSLLPHEMQASRSILSFASVVRAAGHTTSCHTKYTCIRHIICVIFCLYQMHVQEYTMFLLRRGCVSEGQAGLGLDDGKLASAMISLHIASLNYMYEFTVGP